MFLNTHATVGQNQGRYAYAMNRLKIKSRESRVESRNSASMGFPFPLPPSPFRLGISLTEVLIAMGILTIGLLGVAAIFPVGSYYMQKGEIADRGSAIAQAAFNDVVTRGWLNPEHWQVWQDSNISGLTTPPGGPPSTFTRPFADTLRRKRAYHVQSGLSTRDRQQQNSQEFGSVFVIDPAGIASVEIPGAPFLDIGPSANFPAASPELDTPATGYWWNWGDNSSQGTKWPVRRVTMRRDVSSGNAPLFERLTTSGDDLSLDVPAAQDKPSVQPWQLADLNGDDIKEPLARQARGNYSWIVTVSPTTGEARDALASDPTSHSYEVSVVVFYKRPIASVNPADPDAQVDNKNLLQTNERAARAKVVSTGLNGGELLLERSADEPSPSDAPAFSESPFANLRLGNWIMLCGPHPNSTNERPMMVARWYRVLAVEGKDRRLNEEGDYDPAPAANAPERRLVALRGPQWPWQPAQYLSGSTYENNLSNSLYVCIPTGAVAVHSKTIRLEGNSVWSGGASGLGGPPPPPGAPAGSGANPY